MIKTARSGAYHDGSGYLMLDDRRAGGALREFTTFTCSHCSAVKIKNPARQRERGRCPRCSRYLCDTCAALFWRTGECHNTQEMVDLALAHLGEGPFLARGPAGEPLYDTRLRDARRLW